MKLWIKLKQYYKLLLIVLIIFLLLYNRILRNTNIKYLNILTTYDKPLNKNSAIAILQNLTKLSRA